MGKPNSSISERYNREYKTGNVSFYLEDYLPDIEECKFILIKIIEQAVRDLVAFQDSDEPELEDICKEARDFIFDDDYYIQWGDQEINLQTILDILDIDIEWFRNKTRKKMLEKEVD